MRAERPIGFPNAMLGALAVCFALSCFTVFGFPLIGSSPGEVSTANSC
jgi:hypothetical protein